jgi:hypothetical protein
MFIMASKNISGVKSVIQKQPRKKLDFGHALGLPNPS